MHFRVTLPGTTDSWCDHDVIDRQPRCLRRVGQRHTCVVRASETHFPQLSTPQHSSTPHSRYVRLSLSVGLETVYNQANGYLTDVSIVGGLYCDAYGLFSIRSRIEMTQDSLLLNQSMSMVSSTGNK